MKLYKEHQGSLFDKYKYLGPEATLPDLKAALAEHGLVAVPIEPLRHVAPAYKRLTEVPRYKRMAEALIQAAQEK